MTESGIRTNKPFRSCEILSVGTELLMGQVVNTDAAFLARRLSEIGIPSYHQSVVGDNPDRLVEAIRIAVARSGCVLLTGGLGPTADDITMACAARFSGRALQLHAPSLQAIESIAARLNRPLTDNNRKQAMLPEGCIVFPNDRGTAPGCLIELPDDAAGPSALLLFPGPPGELQAMFEAQAASYLTERSPFHFRSTYLRMIGIGESRAEHLLSDLITAQTNPTIAPYCSDGEVMFRITQRVENDTEPDLRPPLVDEVRRRLGEYIYETGSRTMPEVAVDLAVSKGRTVSFAESCTAGMAASMFASVPGASRSLLGGIIAYSDDVKRAMLDVPAGILLEQGAVSEECAIAMAKGCRVRFGSDLAVAVTGIAGPGGATDTKPVGLVHLALADADGVEVRTLHNFGSRERIRYVSALNALDMIRRRLLR
jgi:nicotinamide-nucleotide amidase